MKKTVIIVLILYFFTGLIHNLGHPITPALVSDLGIPDYWFGVFFALMSLGLALGGPFWGILGDRINKKNLILIGLIIYSIGQYIFGNVHNLNVMIIVRFVSGFGVSASATLMLSYLIQKSEVKNKTRNIAWTAAMFAAGASAGYFIGGFITDYLAGTAVVQAETIFLWQAILNTGLAIVTYFVLEDCEQGTGERSNMFQSIKSIKDLNGNLIVFLISLTLTSTAAINLSKYLEVYIDDLGYGAKGIGLFVSVTGVVGILTNIFIVPLVVKFKRNISVMILINLLSALIIFIVFRMNAIIVGLYTVYMLYMVLKTTYAPLETTYISGFASNNEYGKIMGIRQFFFAIGFVIGPLLGGFLYDINPILVFDVSGVLFLLGMSLIMMIRRNLKRDLLT